MARYGRDYYARNKEQVLIRTRDYYKRGGKARQRDLRLLRTYGISQAGYDALFAQQHGICAICSHPETRTVNGNVVPLAVDHNHATSAVRQLLCHRCNTVIGAVGEDVTLLRAMGSYLEAHRVDLLSAA